MASPNGPAPITQTGMRGFLIWFAREQPALFNQIAPGLPKSVPKAFGNYLGDTARRMRIYKARKYSQRTGVGRLGEYYTLPQVSVYSTSLSPVAVNYTAQLTAPSDYLSNATPLTAGNIDASAPAPSLPPIAAAANTGVVSTPVAAAVGSVIGAAASIYMTNQQASVMNSAVQTNLQRAAAGLPPLNTSLASLGVPTVAAGGVFSGTGGLLLLGGLGIAAVLLLGGSKS
jgi:hypothetical protein